MFSVNASETEINTINGHDIYGFLIGDTIQVNIHHGVVLRFIHYGSGHRRCHIEVVIFGDTEKWLLAYLLQHADGRVANYNEMLASVWKNNGLVASYKRLSQVAQSLKEKLSQSGLPDNFIRTVRNQGYRIEGHLITPLHYRVESLICKDRS